MNNNSKEAFVRTAKQRTANYKIVFSVFENNGEYTRREISAITGIDHLEVQRRLSDLENDGKVEKCGKKYENNNPNSIYRKCSQTSMFVKELKPKSKLEKVMTFLINEHPEIHKKALTLLS